MCCVDGEEEHTRLNRLGDLDKLFPPSWKAPSSLLEALQQADIPNAEEVSVACEEIGESVCSSAKTVTGSGVSKEDAAVIACYTFDFGPAAYEFVSIRISISSSIHFPFVISATFSHVDVLTRIKNPFRMLNTALFERNVLKLRKIRGLLVMLLRALRRQPQFREALYCSEE